MTQKRERESLSLISGRKLKGSPRCHQRGRRAAGGLKTEIFTDDGKERRQKRGKSTVSKALFFASMIVKPVKRKASEKEILIL